MKEDVRATLNDAFDPRMSVRQQLLDIQLHQMPQNFAERWSQNLRFIVAADASNELDENALEGESLGYTLEESESSSSSQASLTSELKIIADENQGQLTLPPEPIFQPKATCSCRQKRRFPREGLSKLRVTTKSPAELPGCNHYVAISYCWKVQTEMKPQYAVQTEKGMRNNKARSDILSRAIKFAAYHGIRLIWIDQECIDQDDREDKEEGIQSMDLVYQQATHALALLDARITSEAQGVAFVKAMTGQDFERHEFVFAVEIFQHISLDRWLSRAWCFQESAAAGESMRVLIPCDADLLEDEGLMKVPGELEVTLEGLKQAAAWLASWAESNFETSIPEDRTSNENLKARADQAFESLMEICPTAYQLAHHNPHFRFGCNAGEALHLLRNRECKHLPDRLAILANICNFSVRLNTNKLQQSEEVLGRQHSFSVCFAVLAIMNGDISLLAGSKEQREAEKVSKQPSGEASKCMDIPAWIPAGHTLLHNLPYREEFHPKVFRLSSPVISSAGLGLLGHLWRMDQKVSLHGVQQRFASKWRDCRTAMTSATDKTVSDELYQSIAWSILRKLHAEGLMAVAESIWHCIRPPTTSSPRVECAEGQQEVCADKKPLPESGDSNEAIHSKRSTFQLHLLDIIKFEDYPHPLCSPLQSTSSGFAWIARRAVEDGFLWFGRKRKSSEPSKATTVEPGPEDYCVVDCEGPIALLTPHNDLLEMHPRPQMASEPICWIVTETGRSSEHGEILHGIDLVRGVWKTNKDAPMQYVLE